MTQKSAVDSSTALELARFAPDDLAACERLLREGSKSFHAASLLLPPRVRRPAAALYAFCRVADDAVDDADEAGAVERLRERVDRAYAGNPADSSVDRAFSEVVARFDVPRAIFDLMLEGFSWDAEGRRYEDLSAARAYGVRVASTVGAMMTVVMGPRDRETLARAADLGVAMQLGNIARDVGEDAQRGRIYLPLVWLREAGIDPDAWLASPRWTPALGGVVERLLAEADRLYARSDAGVPRLPADCRVAIRGARLVYSAIGQEVRRAGLDSISRRAVVSMPRKLWLLFLAIGARFERTRPALGAPLDEARVLVDAVAREPARLA